jgi:5-methylcytosine-specific restriction protein A
MQAQRQRENANRDRAVSALYGVSWRKARAVFLREHPLCVCCATTGSITPASVVDHVIPHRGDVRQFWNRENWQSLCKPCHDRKTAREDGGFGRARIETRKTDADMT